jgi:5-methylcytosine-specific restriction endonuclease McrA
MRLFFQNKVHALDREFVAYTFEDWLEFSLIADGYDSIKTIHNHIAIPEIIVSVTFNKLPQKEVKYSRQNVFMRDDYKCQYCGSQFPKTDLTIDHVIPRVRGGKTTWDNVVACCYKCNQIKGHKSLQQAGLRLKRQPKKPKWISPFSESRKGKMCESWKHFEKRMAIDDLD